MKLTIALVFLFAMGLVPHGYGELDSNSTASDTVAQEITAEMPVDIGLNQDSVSPPPANLNAITRSAEIAGGVDVMGLADSIEADANVEITNQSTALTVLTQADGDGVFGARIDAQNSDVLALVVRDAAGNPSEKVLLEAPVPLAWRFGVIGDSIAAATHSNDMCGSGKELMACLEKRLDQHDPAWSYAAGDQPWSLGRKAGYNAAAILSAAQDGAEWKDALQQAQNLFTTETGAELINQVFIGLGSNDVCTEFGRSYDGDVASIAQHIDNTLTYLTDLLAGRDDAAILISSTPDIMQFRDMMHSRQHNFVFNSCQALWDLNGSEVQAEARDSLCKGELGELCQALPGDLQADLVKMYLDSTLDKNDVDEGPCGRVLNSANSDTSRQLAQDFNTTLNDLMARKAALYDGRNGIRVRYSNALFESKIEPYMVSQVDCYHPSRAGQLRIAERVWQGFNPQYVRTDRFFFDAFENPDKCTQEFTDWGGQCWVDGGDRKGFDSWIGSNGWYRLV